MTKVTNARTSSIINRGIPLDMRLPSREPVVMRALTTAQLNAELEKGYDGAMSGRHRGIKDVAADHGFKRGVGRNYF
ncbi:MAG: hypothetical protein FWB96_13500 [Defluviitaleaceae bacterium]|nr:hypothetical protein [Defluviitaleaceae bacterium]MCL2264336.1 hypothetical protein [Defluviitaleaceae bacterium]